MPSQQTQAPASPPQPSATPGPSDSQLAAMLGYITTISGHMLKAQQPEQAPQGQNQPPAGSEPQNGNQTPQAEQQPQDLTPILQKLDVITQELEALKKPKSTSDELEAIKKELADLEQRYEGDTGTQTTN